MILRFKAAQITVNRDEISDIEQLRQIIYDRFGVTPDRQKLLLGGKSFTNSSPGHVPIPSNATKVLILEQKPELQAEVFDKARDAAVHEQLTRAAAARNARYPVTRKEVLEFTFDEVKAMNYGDFGSAQAYLERIRDDKSVQALMKKYKLRVGLLTELDPTINTKFSVVGTPEERLLGLNENAGSVIRLRIRTDDYGGFRSYRDTKLVLCHELAHNTYSEHNSDFWQLCKLYEKEIFELDPFKGQGHRLVK